MKCILIVSRRKSLKSLTFIHFKNALILNVFLYLRYSIILQCWNENPDHRPTFQKLSKEFEDLLQSNANYLDLEPTLVENNAYLQPNPSPLPSPL